MSSRSVRKVSRQDIQLVQNLIERCLQLYMTQREVVETLVDQAKIEPGFTELVWEKLEEENQEFFKAYYMRLVLKQQIVEFNRLLEQQVQLMHQMQSTGVGPMPTSNGSCIPALHQNTGYTTEHLGAHLKQENVQCHAGSSLQDVFCNGGSSLHSNIHAAAEMSGHANRIDAIPNALSSQRSRMGLIPEMNGVMIKSETEYPGSSAFMFGTDANTLEERPTIDDATIASFTSLDSDSQSLNEPLLDQDTSSFGFLTHIPRNFSFSDLTAYSQSSDILEYHKSPFLGTSNENFLDSHDREREIDDKRLDTISEGLSYDDFGSE